MIRNKVVQNVVGPTRSQAAPHSTHAIAVFLPFAAHQAYNAQPPHLEPLATPRSEEDGIQYVDSVTLETSPLRASMAGHVVSRHAGIKPAYVQRGAIE